MPETIRELADDLLSEQEAPYRLDLTFDECLICVRSDSDELIAKLARYYQAFLAPVVAAAPNTLSLTALERPAPDWQLGYLEQPPESGKRRVKEEYCLFPDGRVVRKRLTGMHFVFGLGADCNLAVGPCVANDNQVVNFINNRYIQWRLHRGGLLFHAAAVADPVGGLAVAGFAGAGKSTLSLRLLDGGLDFLSNDRVIGAAGQPPRIFGVPKLPRVNPGTVLNNPRLASVIPAVDRAVFAALPPDELWNLEHKYDVFIDQCYGAGRTRLSAPLRALVILNWRRNHSAPPALQLIRLRDRRDLTPTFMKSPGVFYEPQPGASPQTFAEEDYLSLLDGCAVYEMTGGVDFVRGAELCLDLLGKS